MNLRVPLILLIGDIIALCLFVFAGQRDHNTVDAINPILGVLKTAAPFVVSFVAAASLLGAYPRAEWTPRNLLLRSLNAWLVAAPFALVLRALLNGQGAIPVIFIVTAITFGGIFLMVWRIGFVLIAMRLMRQQNAVGANRSVIHQSRS
jgi:hypothetical protein